jgi:hypothetical protein
VPFISILLNLAASDQKHSQTQLYPIVIFFLPISSFYSCPKGDLECQAGEQIRLADGRASLAFFTTAHPSLAPDDLPSSASALTIAGPHPHPGLAWHWQPRLGAMQESWVRQGGGAGAGWDNPVCPEARPAATAVRFGGSSVTARHGTPTAGSDGRCFHSCSTINPGFCVGGIDGAGPASGCAGGGSGAVPLDHCAVEGGHPDWDGGEPQRRADPCPTRMPSESAIAAASVSCSQVTVSLRCRRR